MENVRQMKINLSIKRKQLIILLVVEAWGPWENRFGWCLRIKFDLISSSLVSVKLSSRDLATNALIGS